MADPSITLPQHEDKSAERSAGIMSKLNEMGDKMSDSVTDKVTEVKNFFGDSGQRGGSMDGIWAAVLPALMANKRDGGGDMGIGGLGAGLVGGVLGGLLFNRRGFGDHDHGGGTDGGSGETRIIDNAANLAILAKLGNLEAAIPANAMAVQAAVAASEANLVNTTLQQTISLKQDNTQLAIGIQNGFSNTKDAIQTGFTVTGAALCGINQNVSSQGCQTREAIATDGDRTRALLVARFQLEDATRIQSQAAEIIELRNEHRRSADSAELRLSINNTNTAVAAQAQGQAQAQQQQQGFLLAEIARTVHGLVQVAHATNSNVIAGNTGAVVTGPQTANPTNVNT